MPSWKSRGIIGRVRGRRAAYPIAAVVAAGVALVLVGCGNAGSATTEAPLNTVQHSAASGAGGTTSAQSAGPAAPVAPGATGQGAGQGSASQQKLAPGTYLIKSLEADLAVADPFQTANDLRQWITATDPRAQSAGVDYEQVGDNSYNVQMTYSVEATIYPQVETYLANYAAGHHGQLLRMHESVQDVTSQYVDLQSQLTNLRAEQQRLLDLLSHASNLSDTLAVEDRLTQVEGQIEQIEGQQNELNGQTTFYAVTINLSPLSSVVSTPRQVPWSPGAIVQAALAAAGAFGEFLATVGIWLGVFAIYIVPALIIVWLARRWVLSRKPKPSAP